jgi:hypothetical protein
MAIASKIITWFKIWSQALTFPFFLIQGCTIGSIIVKNQAAYRPRDRSTHVQAFCIRVGDFPSLRQMPTLMLMNSLLFAAAMQGHVPVVAMTLKRGDKTEGVSAQKRF